MSVKVKVKQMDERIGSPLSRVVERGRDSGVTDRSADAFRKAGFHRDRLQRRLKHRETYDPAGADRSVLADLRRDGYATMKGALDPDRLSATYQEFEGFLDAGEPFDPPPHDAARSQGERDNTGARLSAEDMRRGQRHFRALTNRVTLSDPMVTCPSIVPLVFHRDLYRMASGYLKTVPAVGSVTLRKSFANGLPVYDTLLFHIDRNSPRLLKVFIYLHDVDEGGGPFCYVRGSHRNQFRGAYRHRRWQEDEIIQAYGESAIVNLTANAGDVVLADTSGFHRGTKPVTHDRSMITISYVVHPEFGGRYGRDKIASSDLSRIPAETRAAADLLDRV